jgi:hypothetical protein
MNYENRPWKRPRAKKNAPASWSAVAKRSEATAFVEALNNKKTKTEGPPEDKTNPESHTKSRSHEGGRAARFTPKEIISL